MRNLFTLLFSTLLITACSSQVGNYAKISNTFNVDMADDTAKEISKLYRPAKTHLAIAQDATDAFGLELLSKLRKKGFAIEEDHRSASLSDYFTSSNDTKKTPSNSLNPDDPNLPLKPSGGKGSQSGGKPFAYIVDEISNNLFRVTISIDTKILSRVYLANEEGIKPAGSWTRKE